MATAEAQIAHVLRRTSLGPLPGQVDAFGGDVPAAIDAALDASPLPLTALPEADQAIQWWLDRLRNPAAGLHEKMKVFWHGHLTSSFEKVGSVDLMGTQHALLHEYAVGNFRSLLTEMTIDGAMLRWLDGDPSTYVSPNENYAREVQELFSIGRDHVVEDNVRAAAAALAGWEIRYEQVGGEWEPVAIEYVPEQGMPPGESVVFFGRTIFGGMNSYAEVIDEICDLMVEQPGTYGAFLVRKLYRYFVGVDPSPARLTELTGVFAANDLEVMPVIDDIVRHATFLDDGIRLNRPRFPVEWITAAFAALGFDHLDAERWASDEMGQTLFLPPNVAGWPQSPRWLSASHALVRANYVSWGVWRDEAIPLMEAIGEDADPLGAALAQASLYPDDISARTGAALDEVAAGTEFWDARGRGAMLLGTVVTSPEFAAS